jgi:hypothetical protein
MSPTLCSCHFKIGYLKLEEIFKSERKMSLIIHYQPHNDFGEVRTES